MTPKSVNLVVALVACLGLGCTSRTIWTKRFDFNQPGSTQGVPYALPQTALKVTVTYTAVYQGAKLQRVDIRKPIVVETALVPDFKNLLVATPDFLTDDPWLETDIGFTLDDHMLLQSVSADIKDRTVATVQKLVSAGLHVGGMLLGIAPALRVEESVETEFAHTYAWIPSQCDLEKEIPCPLTSTDIPGDPFTVKISVDTKGLPSGGPDLNSIFARESAEGRGIRGILHAVPAPVLTTVRIEEGKDCSRVACQAVLYYAQFGHIAVVPVTVNPASTRVRTLTFSPCTGGLTGFADKSGSAAYDVAAAMEESTREMRGFVADYRQAQLEEQAQRQTSLERMSSLLQQITSLRDQLQSLAPAKRMESGSADPNRPAADQAAPPG